jgi:hypothetical protein
MGGEKKIRAKTLRIFKIFHSFFDLINVNKKCNTTDKRGRN